MFSPKIEIINYFDELIHQVDIDIEESLKKYKKNQVLGDIECFKNEKRNEKRQVKIYHIVSLFESLEKDNQTVELWSESTKVIDYLNQIRMRAIEELRKAQEETLEYYKHNPSRFNYLKEINDENKLEELKSQLFAEKFYFQVRITRIDNPWIFNLFTIVTDFYMSQSYIDILK